MKFVSAFSVLAIALMLLSGTSLSEQIDPGIVIDWAEQTSSALTQDEEPNPICCKHNITGICFSSSGAGGCPPGTTRVDCPCPWVDPQR